MQHSSRRQGFHRPPQTGDYVFWLAADDEADLWLSTSERTSNKTRIIRLTAWTHSREWDASPGQQSHPVRLMAGREMATA